MECYGVQDYLLEENEDLNYFLVVVTKLFLKLVWDDINRFIMFCDNKELTIAKRLILQLKYQPGSINTH